MDEEEIKRSTFQEWPFLRSNMDRVVGGVFGWRQVNSSLSSLQPRSDPLDAHCSYTYLNTSNLRFGGDFCFCATNFHLKSRYD